MTKEEKFKEKNIKEKVDSTVMVIIYLYILSIAIAIAGYILMALVPSSRIIDVMAKCIIFLLGIGVFNVIFALKRTKWLVYYIVNPIKEIETVAQNFSNGVFDGELVYDADDEIGNLAKSFQTSSETLHRIVIDLNQVLSEFSEGNYAVSSQCRESYVGEFASIMEKLENTARRISDTLLSIKEASNHVALSSEQLTVSSQNLAKGSAEQAEAVESLEETVAEVTEQVVSNSKSTDIVHDKAKDVGMEAVNSQRKMRELTEAMERISSTSSEIEIVITEIEGIASKTKLLALNASIEAARAGESGKGFSVVAEQIRMLAENSAKSAETSRKLLGANLAEVEHGNNVMGETAKSLNNVIDELDVIIEEVANIRISSDKQAVSVQRIKDRVNQIGDAIRTNSCSSQETSATSEELSVETSSLDQLISKFRLIE